MKKVLILSGAGLSADSGILTFRDNGGLWENYEVMEVCSVEGFVADRQKVLDFYDARRADIRDKHPNEAHHMIKRLKEKYGKQIFVITQNVDDLLEKAGCKSVIHLHGKLRELYCEDCGKTFDIGYGSIKQHCICPFCSSKRVRHHVVMFGEQAPEYDTLGRALQEADMLVVIGTSGNVLPVDRYAEFVGCAVLNNLAANYAVEEKYFDHIFYEKASMAAEKIEKLVKDFLRE